jgi:hypothetical protein
MITAPSALYRAARHSICDGILLITTSHVPDSVQIAVGMDYRVTVCDGCPIAKAFKVY